MDNFWPNLLPSPRINGSFENRSIDVALKGCFSDFDTTACVRSALLSFLGCCTLLLCIIRILKLHLMSHPQIHQYLVFYLASFEVLSLTLKWIAFTEYYQLEFTASYLKLLQFVLLCHFHWSLVSRILHFQRLINFIIVPILVIFCFTLTAVTIMGMFSHFSTWVECLAPHWLVLCVAEFVGIQLYVIAGVYITRKINSISALDSFKSEQKWELWSVILVYLFSSVTSVIYYSTLQYLGNEFIGCSGIFEHVQSIYSSVYAVFMIIRYLLPVWVMILVFHPAQGCLSSEDERLLVWSHSGSVTSVFCPNTRCPDVYRQLTFPAENECYYEYPTLRRSASSPAIFSKPPLTPISEEEPMLPPTHIQYDSYGAVGSSLHQADIYVHHVSRARIRHDTGQHNRQKPNDRRIHVSLNQCSDEVESINSSSEKA